MTIAVQSWWPLLVIEIAESHPPLPLFPSKPIDCPLHFIFHKAEFLRPSGKPRLCSQPAHPINYGILVEWSHGNAKYIHSCIPGPSESLTASPIRQNQGNVSDRWPNLRASVRSPATVKSLSVMSRRVARYSGSTDKRCRAFQACLYVERHLRASASNLWTLSHARLVVLWVSALRTCVRKHRDFSPSASRSPSRASVTCALRNSASIIAIVFIDRRSISPGANADGRVICSRSGVNQPSGCSSNMSSDASSDSGPTSRIHCVSSSSFIITDIRFS